MKYSFNEFKNQIPRFSDQETGTKDRDKDRFDNYVTMYDYLKLQGKLSPSEFYRSYQVYSATTETYRQMTRMQDTSKMDMWIDDTVLVIRRKDCASDYVRKHCTPIDFHVSNDYTYILDSSQDYSASINPSTDNMPEAIFTHIEDLYHANHKPYYKVHNTVLDAMLHTRIDEIKIGDLKLPFTSFSILLPERNHTKISQIMVSFNPTSKPNTNNATISSDIAWNMHLCIISKSAVSLNMNIPLNHGDISVEQYIMTYLFHNSHPDKEYILDIVPPALHIVCSVALLATGSHKYFEDDVMEHLLDAYRRSGQKKRDKFMRQSMRVGRTGYSIGRLDSERKLPNGVKYDDDELSQFNRGKRDNESDIKQSRRMHIRGGHYRYQACGQRWQDRKLVWIMPMFVGLNNIDSKVA